MNHSTLRSALVNEIRDLYHAEKQLVKALPKLSKGATSPDLKEALDAHLEETEGHVDRLEKVFDALGERARAKSCAGMAGIVEEGSNTLDEDFDDEVMDAAIIAAAQRAEHYEIAAYGTAAAWADALGLDEAAELLSSILDEEKAADEKLTTLAERGINASATSGDGEMQAGGSSGRGKSGNGASRRTSASGKKDYKGGRVASTVIKNN